MLRLNLSSSFTEVNGLSSARQLVEPFAQELPLGEGKNVGRLGEDGARRDESKNENQVFVQTVQLAVGHTQR